MVRTNLCPNPSFAYGTNGWAKYAPSSLRIASDPAAWGGRERQSPTYLVVDVPAQLQGQIATPGVVPVSAGQALAVSALVRTSPGIGLSVRVEWTVGGRSQVSSAPMLLASSSEGDRPTWVHVAPTGATQARVRFEVRTSGARDNQPGWVHLDDVMIVAAASVEEAVADAATFFDGDTPQQRIGYTQRAITHQWTGTKGLSASREVEGALDMTRAPVAVVEDGQAPRVQLVIPAALAPAGTACYVEGIASTGFKWIPRAGVWTGTGEQRVIGDSLAPINTEFRYRLTTSRGVEVESTPVVRRWQGLSLMTDTAGKMPVNLLWQGADQREMKMRLTEHEVPGRRTPVMVYAPTMGAGTVSLTARTNLKDTPALKLLLGTPTPVALFHNPEHCVQCRAGVCDVDLVTLMSPTGVTMERAARIDVAERIWAIKGTITSLPQASTLLALSTWTDFDGRALTWQALDARRLTWEGFDRTIWQEER